MPHAIIEASANLAQATKDTYISAMVHRQMVECGLFNATDIKTRLYISDDFHVGEAGQSQSFLHVTVLLLEGRPMEKKQALTAAIQTAVREKMPHIDQLSVDIRDMTKETYRK